MIQKAQDIPRVKIPKAIIFFAMGVNNLTGSVEIPDKLFPGNGSDSGIKLISPVEKDVTLGEKISIKGCDCVSFT